MAQLTEINEATVQAYFERLDSFVKPGTELYVLGGSAIALLGAKIRTTADVDVALPYSKLDLASFAVASEKAGLPVNPAFGYPGFGEYIVEFGKRRFYSGCTSTQPWRDQMAKQVRLLGELGGDVIFMDCFGGAPFQGCFNAKHPHGPRVDADWKYRRLIYQDAADHVKSIGKTLGNEVVTDISASYSPFIHSLVNASLDPTSEEYPPLFRYTFPKLITTNRGMHGSDQPHWEEKLRSCLVYGLRYDAELYVCRRLIDEDPPYARVVKECTDLMRKYGEFYFDGTFTVVDSTVLPRAVKRGDFLNADGTKLLTVWYNTSKKPYKTGKGKLVLKPGELKFVVGKAGKAR